MAYRLSKPSLIAAIQHLCRYGDTDVFPHLPELSFVREEEVAIVGELALLDLDAYDPGSAVEALGPKSRFGFRIVHQLQYLDTILLLAAVIELGTKIEGHRPPQDHIDAFSYRFYLGKKGAIFRADRTFKEWLHGQLAYLQANLKIKKVIATDISDFYARITDWRTY